MDPMVVPCAIVIAVLVGCSAFFSLAETAFTSANEVRLKAMANKGDKKAEKGLAVLEDYDRFLTTNLIGNVLANVAAVALATVMFVFLAESLGGFLLSLLFMTIAILICGEVIPKAYASTCPEHCVMRLAGAIGILERVFSPVTWALTKLTRYVGSRAKCETPDTLTEEELEVMIDEIEGDGVIEKEEGELIKSAMRFDDTPVSEIYVPRVDIVGLDVGSTVEDAGRLFMDTGYSRIPVYDGSIDNIVGVVYSKEYFACRYGGGQFTVRSIVRPVKYVPETMSIAAILSDFQKSKVHMAVVLDSYGGTTGIVTLEDVLEELVGDIWDEDGQKDAVRQDDGSWLVRGNANIFDVMEKVGVEFDPGDYEDYSVNGYVFYRLGRTPVRGDTVDCGDAVIRVRTVKGRRAAECVVTASPHSEVSE